ncbi:MAG: ABC transporter ATP-binding protein [Acidobacteriota bacterium]
MTDRRITVLEASGLSKHYATPAGPVVVLSGIDLRLDAGESVSIVGPSGCGKSTLLHILGALDPPSAGHVALDGTNPYTLDEKGLAAFRNRQVGFMFQDHHLLPQCSVLENVLVPTLVTGSADTDAEDRARALLGHVGLGHRLNHRPAELSGGEKQRVALARALIRQPSLVLCDEPTGNLDHDATNTVADLLLELHRRRGTMLIVVTHNLDLAQRFGRTFQLSHARLNQR